MTVWSKGNSKIASLTRNNKEIISIVRNRDNTIIYENSPIIYQNNGSTLDGFNSSNIVYEPPSSGGFSIYTNGEVIRVPYGRYGSCIWTIDDLDNITNFRVEFDSYNNDYDSFPAFMIYDPNSTNWLRFGYFVQSFICQGTYSINPGAWNSIGNWRYQWIHHIVEITPTTYYYGLFTNNESLIAEQRGTHEHPSMNGSRKGLNSGYNRGLDDILYKNIVVSKI